MSTAGFVRDRASTEAAEDAAIQWLVELRSGAVDQATRQAFSNWLQADEHHQDAWNRLAHAVDTTFGGVGAGGRGAIRQTLEQAGIQSIRRRRFIGGALMVASSLAGTGWMLRESRYLEDWPADLHTGTAQRQQFALPDGSMLILNARSSVDIDFNEDRRLVKLRQGELIADVIEPERLPFIVQSVHGNVQALGTRFMVGAAEDFTRALAMRANAEISPRRMVNTSLLRQGQAALFDEQRLIRLQQEVPNQAAAWLDGKLLAFDQPLGDVIDALRPYRRGLIRISPDAAALRVTGNYSLDNSARTLRTLGETLPIHIAENAGGLLTRISINQA